jgi:hypothetical protein
LDKPMCRADIAPEAERPLARMLLDMAGVLAEQEGLDVAGVRIGPVDFGPETHYPHDIEEQQ